MQSDLSKGSTGDYAEIGPELMSSIRFHSFAGSNPHYAEINDIMLQPICCQTSESNTNGEVPSKGSDNKENPYDEPDLLKLGAPGATAAQETSIPHHDYSRLERKIPLIYITSESDGNDDENDTDSSTLHYYNTLESSVEGSGELVDNEARSSPDSEESDIYAGTYLVSNKHHLPTILEHPYHVLEQQSDVLFDMDYQVQGHGEYENSPAFSYGNENEYDRLVNPQLYNMLDYNPGLSRVYDVQNGPYSKLDACVTHRMKRTSKSVTNLDIMSTDIFDDVQYVSPIQTPKLSNRSTERDMNNALEGLLDLSKIEGGTGKSVSKYCGDYERDPVYMENIRSDDSLPNVYQALESNTMDPVQDYDRCFKPPPPRINKTVAAVG